MVKLFWDILNTYKIVYHLNDNQYSWNHDYGGDIVIMHILCSNCKFLLALDMIDIVLKFIIKKT